MTVAEARPATPCAAFVLGRVDYLRAWQIQRRIHRRVAEGLIPNTLLLLEHPHVYTLGRRGKPSDILASPKRLTDLKTQVHSVDRGGETTYHGPGQLAGYPIVNLRKWGGGPLRYVRTLEQALIDTLSEFGIRSESEGRPTGVWVGDSKIAAIGVKISRGVTMHGFALNVDPDLSYFDHIIPCGIHGGRATSMATLLGMEIGVEEVIPVAVHCLGRAFGWAMQQARMDELGTTAP